MQVGPNNHKTYKVIPEYYDKKWVEGRVEGLRKIESVHRVKIAKATLIGEQAISVTFKDCP